MRPISFLLVAVVAFSLLSCGGKHKSTVTPSLVAPSATNGNTVLAELEAMPTPNGVDAAVFQQLKDELAAQLESFQSAKAASAPPSGEGNRVNDLVAFDNGDGTADVLWHYRNIGDYDQNGTVGISDITPIAMHFGEEVSTGDLSLLAVVDGDGNGTIGISDITPIAQHFGAQCTGFVIESSSSEEGPFTPEDTATLPSASATGRLQCSFALPLSPGQWVHVVPVDSTNTQGLASNASSVAVTGGGADVTVGTDTIDTSQTIGPAGGTITGLPGTDLEGVSVEFPPGALFEDVLVELGTNDGNVTPEWGDAGGVIIVLNTGDITDFDQAVSVTIPYTDDTAIPVPYWVDPEGGLHVMQLVAADAGAGTATFQTFHASLFTWIMDILGLTPDETAYATAYRPGKDGMQVVNNGSSYNRGGECFGMTSFSLWYWEHHLASGILFPRFMYNVGGLTGQDIIATRTFISIAQKWNVYWPEIANETTLTNEQNYVIIRNAILNTTSPVLIYLYHTGAGAGAHSVLAYAYNRGDVSMYDPNHPGQTSTAVYSMDTKAFSPYSGYNGIIYNGDGSLHLTESYTNILNDADNQFSGSNEATIKDIYPADESEITARSTTLSGTIESGEVLVEKLKVWAGGGSYTVDVPESGAFSVTIPIERGTNFIFFDTKGHDAGNHWIDVPNNMDTELFTLEGVFDEAAILVTVTWDKNDTDVDTYVIDPTGDYSSYFHKYTADGGWLDVDDTNGYGPEHWTLTYGNTVRWGEDYRVRLHYYSDHGNGGTNYQVSILLYEDTPYQVQYHYSGYLGTSSPGNNQPENSGADWADIATVTPVEHTPSALGGWQPSVRMGIDGIPHITVPVPPPSLRAK